MQLLNNREALIKFYNETDGLDIEKIENNAPNQYPCFVDKETLYCGCEGPILKFFYYADINKMKEDLDKAIMNKVLGVSTPYEKPQIYIDENVRRDLRRN